MIDRSVCYFKKRCKRRATKGDTIRRPSFRTLIGLNDVKGMKTKSGGKKVDQFDQFALW